MKVEATKEAFSKYFDDDVEVVGIEVSSNVSNQPIEDETFKGAENRAVTLKKLNEERNLNARFFVGIESGIKNLFRRWFAFGVMCVMDRKDYYVAGLTVALIPFLNTELYFGL